MLLHAVHDFFFNYGILTGFMLQDRSGIKSTGLVSGQKIWYTIESSIE
ncbi:UNVERIFIED_CONTAM: hypothetical protein NCL1_38669 [Trichonephila clavipes]